MTFQDRLVPGPLSDNSHGANRRRREETICPRCSIKFGTASSSQWIVFASLLVLLVGLSELAWRIGLAIEQEEVGRGQGTAAREIRGTGFV